MGKIEHPYSNISIAFTTMHEKEKILEPLFKRNFFSKIIVPRNIDTDLLGTFSGEIKRDSDLKTALRKKAMIGIEQTGLKFGLASEGSFGPHPWIPFLPCNQESLIFIDVERDIEIISHFISTDNCSEYIEAEDFKQVEEFLIKIRLGEQGLIVKPSHEYIQSTEYIFKGLTKVKDVATAFEKIKLDLNAQTVFVETDNRAHMSPKRRQVIFKSAEKIVEKLKSLCPGCRAPGFDMTSFLPGLVCEGCGSKSDKPLKEVWSCPSKSCSYQEIRDRTDGIKSLDPAECDWCNP